MTKTTRSMTQTEKNQMLKEAVKANDLEGVKRAIELGTDPNVQQERSPLLSVACFCGYHEVADMLINAGADVNKRNIIGSTPLMESARYGYTEVTLSLINAGADVNLKDKYGQTPLMLAIIYGDIKMIKKLIKHNADVNAVNKYGVSVLMYAAMSLRTDVMTMLISAGADPMFKNIKSRTALDILWSKDPEKYNSWLSELNAEARRMVLQKEDSMTLDSTHSGPDFSL